MANRVLVGRRNSTSVGIYVSKPGQNVLTAAPDQLLLSSETGSLQIVASGVTTTSPFATITITIPNLGFRPMIFFSCNRGVGNITYNSNTSVSVAILDNQDELDSWWVQIGKPVLNGDLRYAVTNIPMA